AGRQRPGRPHRPGIRPALLAVRPNGLTMAIHVREKPPLRRSILAIAPNGRRYRWASDEQRPDNVFSGLRDSDTMPGGFESADCALTRKPSVDYGDLTRLSTLIISGPGSEICSEYRLERAPSTSGDKMSISPSAVGW